MLVSTVPCPSAALRLLETMSLYTSEPLKKGLGAYYFKLIIRKLGK
jgi:hypothetical protein